MVQVYSNNAESVLSDTLTVSGTIAKIVSEDAVKFPVLTSPGDFFFVTLTQAATETSHEIVRVTARSSGNFTIERGQQGTTPQEWPALSKFELRWTAQSSVPQVPIGGVVTLTYETPPLVEICGSWYLRTGYVIEASDFPFAPVVTSGPHAGKAGNQNALAVNGYPQYMRMS